MAGLIIGTRGSPLALAQARELKERLAKADPALASDGAIELAIIKTSGDAGELPPVAEIGGKGLFVKEIEEALLEGRIDVAVHSIKDLPAALPEGLEICAVLAREDPRDVFFSPRAASLEALPPGAKIGTGSPRRQAQLLALRPDLKIVPLRGNVETRLRKIRDGAADATILALAGLKRLGLECEATAVLGTDVMLPAAGQGAIGVECRAGDARVKNLVAPVNDQASETCVKAERALLAVLEGSCRTPIAGLAEIEGGVLILRALVATLDGTRVYKVTMRGSLQDAVKIGAEAGAELRAQAGNIVFAA
jgi:hydroxymethylbilane synthase